MAKFCTNCGKQLDENATLCLNCGVFVNNNINTNNKEKKKGLPTWAIVLIVVGCAVILPLLAVVGITVIAFEGIGEVFEEEFFEEPIYQYGTIGDTLENYEYKITLTDSLIYSYIGIEEGYIDVPEEGKEYLVFFFNVENKSNESLYISSYDFDGYVDSYAIPTADIYNNIEGYEELSAELAPGKKAKGFVIYEVEENWQEFDIYIDDLFEESTLVFSVVNEDSSNITGA